MTDYGIYVRRMAFSHLESKLEAELELSVAGDAPRAEQVSFPTTKPSDA